MNSWVKRWTFISCLALATFGLRAQTTLFFEGFEGAFPGPWRVGDFEPSGSPAWWADVNAMGSVSPRTGSWMGYCAGFGNAGTVFAPRYESDMYGYMERTVDLTGQANPVLTFWVNIPSIESTIDAFEVWINNVTLVYILTDSTFGWQQVTLDLSEWAGTSAIIGFWFYSDFSLEYEGAYLDDISLTVAGTPRPNLTPHQPAGYSDKLVLSKVPNTHTDDSGFQPNDPIYVDWAVINNGQATANGPFTIQLLVDDAVRNTWTLSSSLPVNGITFNDDYNVGPLPAGVHNIKIRADAGGTVTEGNEADNEYSKTITITGNPDIRIQPLSLGFTITNSPGESGLTANATEDVAVASPEEKLTQAHEVLEQMDAGAAEVNVIVNLVSPPGKPARREEWESQPRLRGWQRSVQQRQEEVLAALAPDEFNLRHRFENQTGFSGRVTRKGLAALARHPRVASIQYSRPVQPHLAQGIPLMNGSLYRSSYNGSGVAVAIVDSGVDYNHSRLGGGGFPNTKVIGGHDFGDDDADPIPGGNAHGTACAGIAAGNTGAAGDYIGGVAYNAKIYALKITSGASQNASDADILAAWDWCVSHKNDDPNNPILVISTSFGGGRFFGHCDASHSAHVTAAANASAAGMTLLVSSGNSGYCDAIGAPACLSGVISVGAVFDAAFGNTTYCLSADSCAPKYASGLCPATGWATDDTTAPDKVTRYSNTASILDLLAPAHNATTTDIAGTDGYGNGDFTAFGGTSAACPYAAGAVAALQSAAHSTTGQFLSPAQVRALLASTGDLVSDPKATHIIKPRVNLGRAIESLGQNSSFTIFNDGNAPLNVTSITPDTAAPWISLLPPAPFSVPAASAVVVAVSIDGSQAPAGVSTRRLLVNSNDSDESPYPGGVFINVTNTAAARPQLTALLANNRVVICWPTQNASGYVLQWAHALPANTWSNVPLTSVIVGTNRCLTNNILTDGTKFYRLRQN